MRMKRVLYNPTKSILVKFREVGGQTTILLSSYDNKISIRKIEGPYPNFSKVLAIILKEFGDNSSNKNRYCVLRSESQFGTVHYRVLSVDSPRSYHIQESMYGILHFPEKGIIVIDRDAILSLISYIIHSRGEAIECYKNLKHPFYFYRKEKIDTFKGFERISRRAKR